MSKCCCFGGNGFSGSFHDEGCTLGIAERVEWVIADAVQGYYGWAERPSDAANAIAAALHAHGFTVVPEDALRDEDGWTSGRKAMDILKAAAEGALDPPS